MKSLTTILFAFLLLSSLSLTQRVIVAEGDAEDKIYSVKSRVTYINPSDSDTIWNFTEDDRMIGLFMNNSWQNVELRNATHTVISVQTDEDGNKVGVLELPRSRLHPGENMTIAAEYQVVAKPRLIANISESESGTLGGIPEHMVQSYTGAEGPWLTNDPALINLAYEIAGNETNVLTIVKDTIGWIKLNIDYGTHEIPLYANQTLNVGVGDCDDQAVLLITLLRILGIPSYLQIGAVYVPQNVELNQSFWNNRVKIVQRKMGWHGWAEVYVPPWGWLPVDLTFVPQGFDDPLNAVRYGAVTEQNTVQYMNISKVDYVADSLEAKNFIVENGFLLYYEEGMTELSQNGRLRGFNPTVTIILIAAVTIVVSLVTILFMRRRRKRLEQQKPL
ncbi:MAG TPA: transglutaminase domain-containing protein [Candidatus Bathyarchaeia archaeon]|nr:transglutaminase domain-containing protein [Candidatus Bathyarchaeia archaeon]